MQAQPSRGVKHSTTPCALWIGPWRAVTGPSDLPGSCAALLTRGRRCQVLCVIGKESVRRLFELPGYGVRPDSEVVVAVVMF